MGFGSKSGRSSNIHRSSQTGKEKAHLPHADMRLKNQGKSNVKNGITFPYGVLPGEIGNNRIRSALVESKPPLKSRSTKEDELVRYMSNLPGYLQRVDSSDNLQEKALNVGVLDWTRLEKWKHHRKHIPTRSGNDESSTIAISSSKTNTKLSAFSNVVPKVASANKGKQHCSSLTPSQKDGIPRGSKPSIPKVRQYQDIETASKSTLDQQKKTSKMYKSFDKINSDAIIEKGKRNESDQKITSEMRNMPSNMRNHGVSPQPKETARVCDDGSRNRVEKRREKKVNKKDLDDKGTSDVEASSSKSRNHAVSMGSKKMLGAESHKPKNKETQESELDLNHECPPGEHKNIVLPSSVQNNLFEEPRDRALNEAKWNSSSCDLLQKDHFRELYSEVPHSCTFPSGVEMNPETYMIAWGLEPSSNSSSGSLLSDNIENIRSQRKYSADNKTKSQEADFETSRKLEEEMAELATERSRTSSRNRRFSFSLRRISRSFSFKESSAVPQLSSDFVSMRSGPVRPEFSGFLHDVSIGKLNGHHRTRSSPFRRVLDPLLKSKGLNSFGSTDTVQPSKGSLISSTQRPLNTNESFQEEKLGPSKIKALLEVAMKDGLPLFRFVVTNGSNMLATTVKSSASSGKVGSDQNYVFSSVREIKKSGSWISKGNKGKNCGYIYNIIGQMKISYSHISDVSAENSCNDLVRESVLFCVGQRQADQALAKFIPGTELAAVVIKIPGESNLQQADKDVEKTGSTESLATDGCSCNFMESSSFSSTTVILPGGVHGLPNKGMPSPLIDRWRFGGSCDCGGWDIGCKLHVFSNQNKRRCKNSRTHQAFPDRLELYPQGKAHKNMPIFGLVPHRKGIYAIEFSSSITELQAFFISVTVISCRKQSSDLPEFGNLLEGEVIKEKMLDGGFGIDNNPTIPLGTLPAKYAPNPPHSPVGRV